MNNIPPYYLANRGGIPRIQSIGVAVGTDAVTYSFQDHPYSNAPFKGLIIINIAQAIPDGTTGTLPVRFGNISVVTSANVNVTAADITGAGIYLGYYDNIANRVTLIGI